MVETTYHIPGAPRMAILTDLHGRPYKEVTASLQAHKPELIAVAGDVIYGSYSEDDISPLKCQINVIPFLRSCAAVAPTYLSLGNHEWRLNEADFDEIQHTGVILLDNEFIETDCRGRRLVIGGLTSRQATDYRYFPMLQIPIEQEISWLSAFACVPGYHILLCHHPEYFDIIPSDVELVVSGHTHGGQWRIFGRGVFAPGQGMFPKYSRGVYENGRLVVSAGLANTTRIPRIFNPTESVFIE